MLIRGFFLIKTIKKIVSLDIKLPKTQLSNQRVQSFKSAEMRAIQSLQRSTAPIVVWTAMNKVEKHHDWSHNLI